MIIFWYGTNFQSGCYGDKLADAECNKNTEYFMKKSNVFKMLSFGVMFIFQNKVN